VIPRGGGEDAITAIEIANLARRSLEEKKGRDIVLVDVRQRSSVTDYYLIATGTSAPHLKAMLNEVHVALKKRKVAAYRSAGSPDSGWLTLDYVDVVIHIFSPAARRYYAVEELWARAPLLE
jgi:ribosome-associated protein